MTEDEFDRLVDCRFPYRDAREARRLIDLGRAISSNAHFRTLSEICRPPASADVSAPEQFALMRDWAEGFEHPLKDAVMVCATALIARRDLSVDHVLRIMDEIASHRGAYAALGIAYFACDVDDRVEVRSNEISNLWRRDGGRG
jgi:hypothetical protein